MPKKGHKITEEHREKLRQAKLGTKRPKEVCEKIKKNHSKYWLGKSRDKDTIDKIKEKRAKQIIKPFTDEHKSKLSDSQRGKEISIEQRISISLRQSGRTEFTDFMYNINGNVRKTPQYTEWRKQVFERDDYTCQECGKKGCFLEAHHIKSFAEYEKLRFSIDNGITYCRECHCLNDERRMRFSK